MTKRPKRYKSASERREKGVRVRLTIAEARWVNAQPGTASSVIQQLIQAAMETTNRKG